MSKVYFIGIVESATGDQEYCLLDQERSALTSTLFLRSLAIVVAGKNLGSITYDPPTNIPQARVKYLKMSLGDKEAFEKILENQKSGV